MGVEAVSTTPAPSTASSSTRQPSTTMQRLPTNAPSSTITGLAPGGSSTPPSPTPPERCTLRPTWAQDPTGAHARAYVHIPGHDDRALLHVSAVAHHARRDHADSGGGEPALGRDLVVELQVPRLVRLERRQGEVEGDALLDPPVHDPPLGPLGPFRDAQLTPVEAVQDLAHGAGVPLLQQVPLLQDGFDLRAQLRHARTGLPHLRISRILHPRKNCTFPPAAQHVIGPADISRGGRGGKGGGEEIFFFYQLAPPLLPSLCDLCVKRSWARWARRLRLSCSLPGWGPWRGG